MPVLQHKCGYCNYDNNIDVPWIDPNLYTKPKEATVTRGFWCRNEECKEMLYVKYRFPNPDAVKLIENLDIKINKSATPFYINIKNDEESSEETNKKISLGDILSS